MLFLLIIILLEFFGFLTKVFLEIFLRRETTTSCLTPRPTYFSFSISFYHYFWFPNKSFFGYIFEEGDNYILANTSAYLLFLLIIILSIFWFPNKSCFGILFEEGDNYVLANTSAYLLFFLNIILLEFFGFLKFSFFKYY